MTPIVTVPKQGNKVSFRQSAGGPRARARACVTGGTLVQWTATQHREGEAMPDDPRTNCRRHVRAALVRLFGRPCPKHYVLWELAVALGIGIFLCLWVLVPMIPKVTMHAGKDL